nr:Ycf15 [Heliotropium arbainense]YP_010982778.1 Ycf15 [Heliotropium arbainense]WOH22005.1 Ycf15 [Heliotropium arbainense]WOH22006.1 Ycf15 [Heliotropium arbainense]
MYGWYELPKNKNS